jgi:hypothetical protein
LKRTFNVDLSSKELGAVVREYQSESDKDRIDCKPFMIKFMKMGLDKRAKLKAAALDKQRRTEEEMQQEQLRKKRIADQKMVLDVDPDFAAVDREQAMAKIKAASIKYDKKW